MTSLLTSVMQYEYSENGTAVKDYVYEFQNGGIKTWHGLDN